MINHGLSTGALFLIVGMIYERRHTRLISEFGGLCTPMPVFAIIFMIVTLSSIGLPGLNGFVGEFLILLGTFKTNMVYATVAATGVIFAACYMLWMFQRVVFGKVTNEKNKDLKDLSWREIAIFAPLILFIIWIGVYPSTFLDKTKAYDGELRGHDAKGQVHAGFPISTCLRGRRNDLHHTQLPSEQHRAVADPDGDRHPHPGAGCPLPQRAQEGLFLRARPAGPGGGGLADHRPLGQDRHRFCPHGLPGQLLLFLLSDLSPGRGPDGADLPRSTWKTTARTWANITPCILFATVGMMLMAAGAHLIMIFLGLEVMSIAVYVLAGLFREDVRSNEASLKYLILGSFSSAFLLFGMAMLYGAAGRHPVLERAAQAPGLDTGHAQPLIFAGHRPVAGRLRLQGGFGALPHVDPGRL